MTWTSVLLCNSVMLLHLFRPSQACCGPSPCSTGKHNYPALGTIHIHDPVRYMDHSHDAIHLLAVRIWWNEQLCWVSNVWRGGTVPDDIQYLHRLFLRLVTDLDALERPNEFETQADCYVSSQPRHLVSAIH
jgi:hypothetical protein